MTIIATIVAVASEVSGFAATPESTIDDLAFDSLMSVEFTAAVEDATGVEILCHERLDFATLAEVAALVDARTGGATLAA